MLAGLALPRPLRFPLPAGMTDGFVWDVGTQQQRVASGAETRALLDEIHGVITSSCRHLLYSHKVPARLPQLAALPPGLLPAVVRADGVPAVLPFVKPLGALVG